MKVVHTWLKDYIGDSIQSAQQIEALLTFHAFEVEGIETVAGHEVIEIKILPDRGSDCLSHRGIARELASITGVPLAYDPLHNAERLPLFSDIAVTIADTHACTRFGAALITGIEVKDSPLWLQDRLRALGQRPINNIVDATNYVMYALGQPLHAYDAEKFPQTEGKWKFDVRFATPGETVSLIAEGGKTEDRIAALQGSELLIVDGSSNRPIGLAGVKGGAYAGVDTTTSKIIVEAAHFDPVITRRTARRLGIVIDASKRFENNPSSELVPHALREVCALILEIAGGACTGSVDINPLPVSKTEVRLQASQVNALLGLSLSSEEMTSILKRIGATVIQQGDEFVLTAPFERTDLNIPEDYIEEIGRIHGYASVVSVVPDVVPLSEFNARHYYSEQVRRVLLDAGFSEVITSSFVNKDVLQLRNAIASDKSYLRSTLRNTIKEALDKNANLVDLLGAHVTRVFEIGTVFSKVDGVVHEHVSLCLGVRTKVKGYSAADDTALNTLIGTIESTLGASCSFVTQEGVAECNFTEAFSKLPSPTQYEKVAVAEEIIYKPFSLYPAVSRDIALWVTEGTEAGDVQSVLDAHAGDLRVRTTFVDVFTKEGRTSLAFRLVFQSYEKTLTDVEVNAIMDAVYVAVRAKGWEVR
jgi:phenylalanyl-tRNA synthetase beta chain